MKGERCTHLHFIVSFCSVRVCVKTARPNSSLQHPEEIAECRLMADYTLGSGVVDIDGAQRDRVCCVGAREQLNFASNKEVVNLGLRVAYSIGDC